MRWRVGHTTWRERFASTLQIRVWGGKKPNAIPQKWDMRASQGRRQTLFRTSIFLVTFIFLNKFECFSQTPRLRAGPADVELATLAQWMTGSFDTFAQVDADLASGAPYTHLRAVMHIVPVLIPGLSGPNDLTLYVEQAAAGSEHAPYRQRVYHLTRRDGVPVNRIFRLVEPQRRVGGHAQPELLAGLSPDELTLEPGCDLVWTRVEAELYSGIAGLHGTCRTTWRGAAYTVSQVLMTPTTIISLDQGFDADGRQVWGPPLGVPGHIFRKRGTPDPAGALEAAREFAALRGGDGGKPVYWYVEGTIYDLDANGRYTPLHGLAGFNVARLDPAWVGDVRRLRSREIFFTTDLQHTELKPTPPLIAEVEFGIGVRAGEPVAGLGFTVNGAGLAQRVPPTVIRAFAHNGRACWFVSPFVFAATQEGRGWAAETYQFCQPTETPEGDRRPTLVWQRDTEGPAGGRTHAVAVGRRYLSLEEVAAASPLAAQVVRTVREHFPALTTPPGPGDAPASTDSFLRSGLRPRHGKSQ